MTSLTKQTESILGSQTTTINIKYLKNLEQGSHMLECLDACGVVDWEGYKEAKEMYDEDNMEFGQ